MSAMDPASPVATSAYVEEARRLSEAARPRFSEVSRTCLAVAQDEARTLDDDHVGTEHVLLALWAIGPNAAVQALDAVGVSRDLFRAQLFDEPGRSPEGAILYTPRALMIVGLAGLEADRLGSVTIEPEHVLLGAIRESERWASVKTGGPQHLLAAVAAAGSTPEALELEITYRCR